MYTEFFDTWLINASDEVSIELSVCAIESVKKDFWK